MGDVVIFEIRILEYYIYKDKYKKYSQKTPQNCDTMTLFSKNYCWMDPVILQMIIFKSFFL